ncbi:CLUMA_CG018365, isoform A [Clunio marinus]|uniref:CLUMA_CG018365, isoform A n=1 Tax=Clunio marinus TaxID=568069 RepID=A0A1J1IXJ5_9DIPT|nr:CLUMA_CG018365, isoform A [Clunio marinus]
MWFRLIPIPSSPSTNMRILYEKLPPIDTSKKILQYLYQVHRMTDLDVEHTFSIVRRYDHDHDHNSFQDSFNVLQEFHRIHHNEMSQNPINCLP